MKNTLPHIKNTGSFVFMLVLMFALSPCTVKASVYQVLDVEYQSPLNKAKLSQTQLNTCSSQVFTQTKTVKTHKVIVVDTPNSAYRFLDTTFPAYSETTQKAHFKNSPGVSPPLYILYNRFKDDIV